MDKPLSKWYCDVCGGTIADAKHGYVIWKTDPENKDHSFKIIHQSKCDRKDHGSSLALEDFLGPIGLARLLAFLSLGPIKMHGRDKSVCTPKNMDEFVDFFRRVQCPYYEEARLHFNKSECLDDFADANEVLPYLPDSLRHVLQRYADNK